MKKIISNYDDFVTRFYSDVIDVAMSPDEYRANPFRKNIRYFGEIKWGRFTVYGVCKTIVYNNLVFKVVGQLDYNQVHMKFTLYNWPLLLVNSFVVLYFSILIYWQSPVLGTAIILVFLLHLTVLMVQYFKCKREFITRIEDVG